MSKVHKIKDNETEPPKQANLRAANIGQLVPHENEALIGVLQDFSGVFVVNPKAVDTCIGPLMILKLKNPSSEPYATPLRRHTSEQWWMTQVEMEKLHKARATGSFENQYAS